MVATKLVNSLKNKKHLEIFIKFYQPHKISYQPHKTPISLSFLFSIPQWTADTASLFFEYKPCHFQLKILELGKSPIPEFSFNLFMRNQQSFA
jgi:hypothetical protein